MDTIRHPNLLLILAHKLFECIMKLTVPVHHETHLFVLSAFWHYVPSCYCRPNMHSLCRLPPASHHAPATQMRPPLASSKHYTMHTLPAPNLLLASHSLDQFVRNPYQRPMFSFLRHHWKAYSGCILEVCCRPLPAVCHPSNAYFIGW